MFRRADIPRQPEACRTALDSNELERERGITILSKNTAVNWKGVRINLVDTPGHADFGGEVERVLSMVSGALVLVDAAEGPMPQTRFVLLRALALDLPLLLVVNKTDRPDARPDEALINTQLLLMELGASEERIASPVVYASGREDRAGRSPDALEDGLSPLFDAILEHIPCPVGDPDGPVRMQVSTIDYNEYVGRIAIGRIDRGTLRGGDAIALSTPDGPAPGEATRVTSIMMFEGLTRIPVPSATVGDIAALSGIGRIEIGDTLCHPDHPDPLPVIRVSAPTVAMDFHVNTGPLAGRDGKYVTSRQIGERLRREAQSDVALRLEDTGRTDTFRVCGRGELHLSILVETMRREGYEFMVSKPDVITRMGPQGKEEPIERLTLDIPEASVGPIMENLSQRRAELSDMRTRNGRGHLTFLIPSRDSSGSGTTC
jgi:GTP-binding protein